MLRPAELRARPRPRRVGAFARGTRFASAVAVLVAVLAGLAGQACARSPGAATERPLEVVVPTEVFTLDPRFATRSLDVKVTRLVHAGLVGLDPDTLAPIPRVAEAYAFVDPSTLDVRLRAGVTFHSGRPLTPADVCATLAAVADPATGSPHRPIVEAIGRCEVTSPLSLRLTLRAARATLLTDLEIPILRADQARLPPDADGELDGLGPFAVAHVFPGEVALSPRRTGVVPEPRHAVVIRTVRDENARVGRLLSGRSDVAPNGVSPPLLPAVVRQSGVALASRPGANLTYLLFQNDRAPLDRVEVRRAVARSIDRALIASTLFAGYAKPADSLMPPGHWAAFDVPGQPFSPGEARSVLASLPATTLLTSTDRPRVTLARAVAQMLGDAGLRVEVLPLDLGVMLARLDAGDFDLAILQIPELTEPNVLSWFFHPAGVPGEGGRGKNRARYRSAAAGRLLDLASASSDQAERRRYYIAFAEQFAKDLPIVPLWHEDQIAVVSGRAAGFLPSAEGRWFGLAGLE